ncbi:DUF1214 domain-containing protein [Brevibacterium atlanticum]|uniref:DUF1214 domain-containing protein n=1 Tax=Brevibacterium atlanticum TaxID=2697563 RepID=UPI001D18EE2B|nr:DUF1214 domain-containing protein [Brevibacterium atlanticum]
MMDSPIPVTVDNYARAETARMFTALTRAAGGANRWKHNRTPTEISAQEVIRMNRDTLYSFLVLDVSQGASVTIPDAGDRYISVMVVTEDHYVPTIFHDAGTYELSAVDLGSEFVVVAARILVDPQSEKDVAEVARLQDGLSATSTAGRDYHAPNFDPESLTETTQALTVLARGMTDFTEAFGRNDEVERLSHLAGVAVGWGGLPASEARYINVSPRLPVGEFRLRVTDVPVDGFWSISVYNGAGFFEPNDAEAYSLNNITAHRDDDGGVTVHFGGDTDVPNTLPIVEGWNYLFRLYRPRPEAAAWTPPDLTEV